MFSPFILLFFNLTVGKKVIDLGTQIEYLISRKTHRNIYKSRKKLFLNNNKNRFIDLLWCLIKSPFWQEESYKTPQIIRSGPTSGATAVYYRRGGIL